MNLETLITTLVNNPNKALLFEYAPNVYAGTNYHLTEIKTATISSVDCGGVSHEWSETLFQLWENPLEIEKKSYMTTTKILEIISKVNSIKPLLVDTEVKIEYGNAIFHTSNLNIKNIIIGELQVIIQLHIEKTKCKAPELCGVPESDSVGSQTCSPGGDCC